MTRQTTSPAAALTPEQWRRVEELLAVALDLSASARGRFLERECAGDGVLRAELESLLAAHDRSGLLDRPLTGRPALPAGEPGLPRIVAHYELQDWLGGGGMGVVYRARDLRLERTVALKFLPPTLSADTEAKRRFLHEARAAAALEHANVCTVHEIAETPEGQLFIAMAFVAGRSLREVIAQGRLPWRTAVDIARQVAAGLESAHSRAIVHRDIKPANIMVGVDGVVKLVDFGVAKLAGSTLTNSGVIPGTAAYMSPEQICGEEIDSRTDLWALGVVLYEMLSGERPFVAETDAGVMHGIVSREPKALRTLHADLPVQLQEVVERALAKRREQRFTSATEMRAALQRIAANNAALPKEAAPLAVAGAGLRSWLRRRARSRRTWLTIAGALTLAAAGVGFYVSARPRDSANPDTLRLSIFAPGPVTPQMAPALSPDGRRVAFVATDSAGDAMLWLRSLDRLEALRLPGTERAAHPFWSPDGRSLGFIADNRLKRIDIETQEVQILADTVVRWGAAWGSGGKILFTARSNELAAVAASGGFVTRVLKGDSETRLLWPRFLPDGRHFIYYRATAHPEERGIYVGSLDSSETRLLLRNDFRAWYAHPGYLVYARDETLLAQPFDTRRLQLSGEPVVIANGAWFVRTGWNSSFSVSETGALAYVNATLWDGQLAWVDRGGNYLSTNRPVRYEGQTPQISPDGRRVAVARGEFGREDVWLLGSTGETASRFTFSAERDGMPVWAADSRHVMFTTGQRLVVKNADSGVEEILLDTVPGLLQDWSRDGRFAVFERLGSQSELWVVPLEGDRTPFPLLQTPHNEAQAQLSPNGRWIAYTSNETGRDQVYVQAFPNAGRKRQVSTTGGAMPRWRDDGNELFYLASNRYLMAVPILDSLTLNLGRAAALFRTRLYVEGAESVSLPTRYDVSPDGQRFLFRYPPIDPGPPLTVVINWMDALKK